MSAFVVEDETINRIAGSIEGFVAGGRGLYAPQIGNYPRLAALVSEPERLAESMFLLNTAAVRARYDDADKAEMIPEEFIFCGRMPQPITAFVKSLNCFLYQCSEGDIPDRPLFDDLSRLAQECCGLIVRSSKEYEAAPWG